MTSSAGLFSIVKTAMTDRVNSLVDTSRPEGQVFLTATAGTEVGKAAMFGPLEKLCKPVIVPAALTIALRDGEVDQTDTALLVLTAAGYTAGDVILMLGGGHASRSTGRLIAGAAAFASGHLALGAVMLRSGMRPKPAQMAVHGAVASVAGAALLSKGRANAPLAAYSSLLAALSALATSVDKSSGPAASVLAVGGPLFLASDGLILARRAVKKGSIPARALDVSVIDTYAIAVLLLLTGTAAAARHQRPIL